MFDISSLIGTIFFELLPDRGYTDSFGVVIGVTIACWVVTFLLAFLLPKKAREGMIAH